MLMAVTRISMAVAQRVHRSPCAPRAAVKGTVIQAALEAPWQAALALSGTAAAMAGALPGPAAAEAEAEVPRDPTAMAGMGAPTITPQPAAAAAAPTRAAVQRGPRT